METDAVVVVGASAGGVEALREMVAALPADFPAPVVVVLHVPPEGTSVLPRILERAGVLAARHARHGEPLEPGTIVVAPPDRHLVVYDHAVALSRGPKENGHRPAIDVTLRTAARALGSRVIGVVLSGTLDDGAAGMVAVTLRGGRGVVQDPEEALYDSMPLAARRAAGLTLSARAADIPALLCQLIEELPASTAEEPSDLMEVESAMGASETAAFDDPNRPGQPSGLSCPDCHGVLFTIEEGGLNRYRCRVGHAWSPESLQAAQTSSVESALWVALRALEEKIAFSRNSARRAADQDRPLVEQRFLAQAVDVQEAAHILKGVIDDLDIDHP